MPGMRRALPWNSSQRSLLPAMEMVHNCRPHCSLLQSLQHLHA